MDKKQILLWKLADLLEANNIEFSLSCGTLLGAYRDGNFIPWDENDADIMIDVKYMEKVSQLIESNNWKYKGKHRRELAVYLEDSMLPLHVDMFFIDHKGEYSYLYSYKPNPADRGRWTKEWRFKFLTSCLYPFKTINFLGRVFNIPNDVESWFLPIYGENWKTPKVYKCTTFDICNTKEEDYEIE